MGTRQMSFSRALWWLLPLALGLSVLAALAGWRLGGHHRAQPLDPRSADLVTQFRLPSLDGRQIGPADFRGQVVVVDFWATWCSPCHVQAKILRSLYEEFRGEGVEFLAVSLGEDEQTVRAFVDRSPLPYTVLVDSRDSLATEAGIYALPTVMVIDREGAVAYLEPGISDGRTLRGVLQGAGAG